MPVTDPGSKMYANNTSPAFTQEMFEDVGNGVAVALLDHIGMNPISRIPLSCYRTVENVNDDITNNLAKYSAGQVNVCGVNHFSATNTKVGKQYQSNKDVPLLKQFTGKKSSSIGKERAGTFGIPKKLPIQNEKKRPPKKETAVKPKSFVLGETVDPEER